MRSFALTSTGPICVVLEYRRLTSLHQICNYKPNFKGVGMNPEQFIKNNVVKALLTDGYSAEQAEQGGGRGYFVLPALIKADNQAKKYL